MKGALIVDDHPLMRMAIRLILEKNNVEVLGEASDGPTAIHLAKQLYPSLVILDISIPKMDGLEVISRMRAQGMQQKILVISSHNQEHFASRSALAGAQGFIGKNEALDELWEAVKTLLSGRVYFPLGVFPQGHRTIQSQSDSESQRISSLSNREMIVLQYLARGWNNKAIAEELLLSSKTVSTYKARLQTKLETQNIVDLLSLAKRHALIE
ncbi:response regulator transcription factor [Pantoea sp. LS15]|uniref:response regulator transcription factor n=1 Tax=Enterobacterales TaxID=91347 RepID=UPI000E0F5A0E|nr:MULTISPECIES: response regulator transcription factor [Enterobacterales]NJQ21790.1 response regulator transcription factor [Pantoea sp. LS15]NKF48386.1 response regulator transcription factor [Pantoea sp. LS15]RDK12944.1 DNA-binding response regulator [Enterobacter sp. 9-2]